MSKFNLYRLLLLGLVAFAIGATPSPAKLDIVVCADQAWDQGFVDLVKETYGDFADVDFALGRYGASALASTTVTARLARADLIVFGRSCASANYCNTTVTPIWNNLAVPQIAFNCWLLRSDRWAWFNIASVDGNTGSTFSELMVTSTTHPIFNGLSITTSSLKIFSAPQILRYINLDMTGNNGTVLGKVNATGNNSTVMAYWKAGTPFYTGSTYTPPAPRLVLSITDDFNKTPADANVVADQWQTTITPEGRKLVKNALIFMLPRPNAVKSSAMFE